MNEQHNIDRLFQEKLKNFEVQPHPEVWQNIKQKLTKKKRRILPMWWFGGVASLLIGGFLLYPVFYKNQITKPKESIPVITTIPQEKIDKNIIKKNTFNNSPFKIEEEKAIVNFENNKTNYQGVDKHKKTARISKETIKAKKGHIVLSKRQNEEEQKLVDLIDKKSVISREKEEKIATNKNLLTEKEEEKDTIQQKQNINKPLKSLLAEVEKDSILIKKNKNKKWAVQPVFGVISSSSLSGGSPIDASLLNNPISGENTVAYGVNISLELNDKWTIQTGIHLQQTEYNTQNLVIVTGANTNDLQSINELSNQSFTIGSSTEDFIDINSSLNQTIISNNATLKQTYNYFEIPIELKYKVLNYRRFNTNLVGGFSALILNKNQASINSFELTQSLGETTNLNSFNFSGNIGLDINYIFDKNWQLNIAPMLKTQFNTFSNNPNSFKPYLIGVYTGIKYQF